MSRPIQARVDLEALSSNLRIARKRAPSARIMAVVKAAAYGHGLSRTINALGEADGFALLDMDEAVALREKGVRQTLLLLEGFFTPDDVTRAAQFDIACAIHSASQIAMLDACPGRHALSLWLKINTGMNRLGFMPQEVPAVIEKLKSHPAVKDITLMTHFAEADEAAGVAGQLEVFNAATAPYRMPRSLANSAALLRYPETHGDWVRPGIMLYGASPFTEVSANALGLKPAITLHSKIISVRTLKAGARVGYGGAFAADAPMRIGIVAAGYADGYPRHAQTGTPVLVEGVRTRTLGRVSMDMLCVDLSTYPDADIGSGVTLWGEGLPVEEVARAAGTISYELLCALAARVPLVSG
jgi:alanine racemase